MNVEPDGMRVPAVGVVGGAGVDASIRLHRPAHLKFGHSLPTSLHRHTLGVPMRGWQDRECMLKRF